MALSRTVPGAPPELAVSARKILMRSTLSRMTRLEKAPGAGLDDEATGPAGAGVKNEADRPADAGEPNVASEPERSVKATDGPTVAQVMRPGYRLKSKVLRPAMVVVRG